MQMPSAVAPGACRTTYGMLSVAATCRRARVHSISTSQVRGAGRPSAGKPSSTDASVGLVQTEAVIPRFLPGRRSGVAPAHGGVQLKLPAPPTCCLVHSAACCSCQPPVAAPAWAADTPSTILKHSPHPAEEQQQQQQQQPSRPPRASGGAGNLRPAKAVQRFSLASLGSVLRQRVGQAQPRRASEASAGSRGAAEVDSRSAQPSGPRVRCATQWFLWLWVASWPQPLVLRPACCLPDGVCNM